MNLDIVFSTNLFFHTSDGFNADVPFNFFQQEMKIQTAIYRMKTGSTAMRNIICPSIKFQSEERGDAEGNTMYMSMKLFLVETKVGLMSRGVGW